MTQPALSVVIATSPGREQHLRCCLEALAQQRYRDFEVIVSDDGSAGMQAVLAAFEGRFKRLEYLWRPQDRNLARSRNRGAASAQGEWLVFANTDVYFNPFALAAYAHYASQHPQATLWGYIGCRKRVSAASLWFPGQRVNWLDFRFFPLSEEKVWVHPELMRRPHTLASGHHFALSRVNFEGMGPLNEAFQDWGEEDVEYALRGLLRGHSMLFIGDAWAEHGEHPYAEAFHTGAAQQLRPKLETIVALEAQLYRAPSGTGARVLFGPELAVLNGHIQRHYLPHAPAALTQEMQS
ncbi:MAG: glycosyltransferase family 2 protein [Candidatus Sericytochromatia bacterium]